MSGSARLDGKVAVVTGGASGIGEGTVRLFANEGARVVIADLQDAKGQHLAEELGTTTSYLRTDVSDEDQVRAAVEHAVAKFGRLDCMFNNAGFGGVGGPIEDTDMAGYDSTMAVLLRGVFLGIKHSARVMKAQGAGSIISTASIAGLQAGFGPHVCSAAKAAVIHLSRSVSVEVAPFGVRSNVICPGVTVTNIFTAQRGLTEQQAQAALPLVDAALADWAPMRRSGQPADIAEAALWLASDASSYVTGQAIVVDGGLTAGRQIGDFGARLASALGVNPAAMPNQGR